MIISNTVRNLALGAIAATGLAAGTAGCTTTSGNLSDFGHTTGATKQAEVAINAINADRIAKGKLHIPETAVRIDPKSTPSSETSSPALPPSLAEKEAPTAPTRIAADAIPARY